MKVLVTGTAGNIGSHTVRELFQHDNIVSVLDTMEYGSKRALQGVRLLQGDVTDSALLQRIFQQERPDGVEEEV